MSTSRIGRLACVIVLAGLVGCDGNPRTYPIPGRLVYTDGQAVPGASVVLQTTTDGRTISARGMADREGQFRLTTFRPGDGVVAGEHDVSVSPIPAPDDNKPVAPPVAPRYWDFATSGLKVTVAPDTAELVITLDRKR